MKLVEPPPVEAAYLSLPSRDLGGDTQAPRAAGQWVLLAGSPGTPQKQLDPPTPPWWPFTLEMCLLGSSFNAKSKIGLLQRLCDERHDSRYVVLFRHAVCN